MTSQVVISDTCGLEPEAPAAPKTRTLTHSPARIRTWCLGPGVRVPFQDSPALPHLQCLQPAAGVGVRREEALQQLEAGDPGFCTGSVCPSLL